MSPDTRARCCRQGRKRDKEGQRSRIGICMGGSRGGAVALVVLALLIVGFLGTAPAAEASHWCNPLTATFGPTTGAAGSVVSISITLTNGIADSTAVRAILVECSGVSA